MSDCNNVSYLYIANAFSPVHSGGASGNLLADFEIQKEPRENIPKIDSSTWKGSIATFLSEEQKKGEFSEFTFSDLKLLFFPVASSNQPFTLVTSWTRLMEFFKLSKIYDVINTEYLDDIREELGKKTRMIPIRHIMIKQKESSVFIGGCSYVVKELNKDAEEALSKLAKIINQPVERIGIINHLDFVDIVNYELEYITRVRLGEEKVAVDQNLFVEEYLPEESILYGFITKFRNLQKKCEEKERENFIDNMPDIVQIGKNSTLGKGIVQLKRWEGKNE